MEELDEEKKEIQEVIKPESEFNSKTLTAEEVEVLLEQQEREFEQMIQVQLTQVRQGPIPPPEDFKFYKQVDKSLPNRIMALAENEQNFRHNSTYFGQIGFIFIVLLGYIISAYTAMNGAPVVGGIIAAGISYIAYVYKSNKPKPPKPQNNDSETK